MVLSSPGTLGNRFYWRPLHSRKRMPLSVCRAQARLRPLALSESSSRMIGSISSQSSSGTSQMVPNVSCRVMRFLRLLMEKPYESSSKQLYASAGQDFETVTKGALKHAKGGRLRLNDGFCVKLRPEWKDHAWAYDFVQVKPMTAQWCGC